MIKEVISKYKYKTELHAHTSPVSRCADFKPDEVIKTYAAAGADSIVITNHLTPETIAYDEVKSYLDDYFLALDAGKKLGVKVILGAEIRFEENKNDYLVYGICPDDIEKMASYIPRGLREFYKDFKNEKNLIIQAHPFHKGLERAPLDCIDGVESFNLHPRHNRPVGITAKYAKENDLLVTGASDYHHEGHEAMCLVRSKNLLRDSYDVAELIKSKDYLFDIWGNIIFPYGAR